MGHILLMAHHLGPASAIFCPVGTRFGVSPRVALEAHVGECMSLEYALQQRIQFGFRVDGLNLGRDGFSSFVQPQSVDSTDCLDFYTTLCFILAKGDSPSNHWKVDLHACDL